MRVRVLRLLEYLGYFVKYRVVRKTKVSSQEVNEHTRRRHDAIDAIFDLELILALSRTRAIGDGNVKVMLSMT